MGRDVPEIRLRTARNSAHPWIWRKMVRPMRLPPGAEVRVTDRDGTPVGRALYHPDSEIALRLISADPDEALDGAFLRRRLAASKRLREDVLGLPRVTDAWRVLNAEGDGCSGLVIDRFAAHAVVLVYAAGWWRLRDTIADALRETFPGITVHVRTDARASRHEAMPLVEPPPARTVIREGAATFAVDAAGGHKSGFFCDQRENRLAFASLVAGREVLDGCCYTGAFAVQAAKAGARAVAAVDLDEAVLEVARENGRRNGATVEWVHADLFDHLRAAGAGRYDAMVLDPAGWGKVRAEVPKALHQYRDLNRLGLQALRPGGLLLTCCCSGLVTEAMFLSTLRTAAEEARRDLRVLRVSGAAADHPVPLHFPEGRYLTAVLGVVE